MNKIFSLITTVFASLVFLGNSANAELWDEVEHGYADNNGIKIHYASVGEGPLVIMMAFQIFGIAGAIRWKD